jgi:hypothetical protein
MLKEMVASNAAKLVAACVCPVVGAGVVTLKVPQVREAVHKATSPKPKRDARAKPRVRTPKKEAARKQEEQDRPVETAQMCADPDLLRTGPLEPTATAMISMPPPRIDVRPPERIFVTQNCPGVQIIGGGITGARIAGVPEPATWAQMIAGFSLMGGTIRAGRRRRGGHIRVTRAA